MPVDRNELLNRVIALSRVYRSAADSIVDRAAALRQNGQITPKEYERVFEDYYQPLRRLAVGMLLDADYRLADDLSLQIAAIEAETAKLAGVLHKIGEVTKIVSAAASVLSMAASLAAVIAAPTPQNVGGLAGAAGSAVASIASAIG